VYVLLLCLCFLLPVCSAATTRPKTSGLKSSGYRAVVFKGEVLAREIAKTTGIALNPLLCMSALGAYTYYSTDQAARTGLPWHASPKFWGPLAFVLLLIFVKDSSKIALPKILTVPLDAAETLLEKKATALLALPMLFSAISNGEFEQVQQGAQQVVDAVFPLAFAAGTTMDMAAQSSPDMVTTLLTYAVIVTLFVVVWVLSHAFNILILLCPFSSFDMVLATARNTLVAAVMGLSNTPFGLGLSLVVIVVAVWFFPRALRLVLFGTLVSYDIVLYRLLRRPVPAASLYPVTGFTCCPIADIAPRTYGRIDQEQGEVVLRCRPGIFRREQTVRTGVKTSGCFLKPGILSPVVSQRPVAREDVDFFRLRPQYHDVIEKVAEHLHIKVARETSLVGKLGVWLKWCLAVMKQSPCLEVPPEV